MLERQAAQLAALRAGADTEDLHATPEAFKALEAFASARNVAADRWQKKAEAAEAEAETLHAAAEGWRKRAEAAEAKLTGPLPCDVKIPGTLICAGVKIETLLLAISRREPGTKLPERKPAVSWDAVAEARRQALEEAAQAVESGLDDIDGCGNSKDGAEAIALMVRTMRRRAAAIRALAYKPAAGGADD
ncbi:hypothetical protein ACRC7T_14125 [Segnochrobactraceae bacterium EtOH-i3]